MNKSIIEITSEDWRWGDYVAHLERVKMARHALHRGQPIQDGIYLAALEREVIVGHISLKVQPIVVPATEWSQNQALVLRDAVGEVLTETYVQTFAVEEPYRRRGYGRALQAAAVEQTRAQGCYQMRSWSSTDKPANYALKLAMRFAVHPTTFALPDGRLISGAYFVKLA